MLILDLDKFKDQKRTIIDSTVRGGSRHLKEGGFKGCQIFSFHSKTQIFGWRKPFNVDCLEAIFLRLY